MNHANPLLGINKTPMPPKICQSSASAVTHSDGSRILASFSKIEAAEAVETKGLDFLLSTLMALSRDAEAGMKWNVHRGCQQIMKDPIADAAVSLSRMLEALKRLEAPEHARVAADLRHAIN